MLGMHRDAWGCSGMHGDAQGCSLVGAYKFNRRLECAIQAKCYLSPLQIWDEKIQLVRQFVECMELIPSRTVLALPIYLHKFEWECREKLANGLPDDLKDYYLPLIL